MVSPKLSYLFAFFLMLPTAHFAAGRLESRGLSSIPAHTVSLNDLKTRGRIVNARVPSTLKRMPVVGQAYLDAFTVLSEENACSRFFGGSAAALTVLNDFASKLRSAPLDDPSVGISMAGAISRVHNMALGISYRLFDDAIVNTAGPFANGIRPLNAHVGSFPANSREARVLMLLHELGHLMIDENGNPLLANDGGEDGMMQSMHNNEIIEQRCGEQIRAVRSAVGEIVRAK